LEAALGRVLRDLRRQLDQVRQRHVFRQPLVNISLQRERLSGQLARLGLLVRHTFGNHQELLRVPEARLAALDPRRVLERGYALVTDGATGQLVTRREQLRLKQPLGVTFADGSARVRVTELLEE
jgi:exodeoxyribonuclease VII large subunit